jgi:hypothetical protein
LCLSKLVAQANFLSGITFMIKKNVFLKLCLVATTLVSFSVLGEPVKLPESFPLTMTFRAFDNSKLGSDTFKSQLEKQAPYFWIHAPGVDEKTIAIRKRWPNKIITIQNAYGGLPEKYFAEVWPGHLLYKAGTLITQDISAQDKTISVEDISRIAKNQLKVDRINKQFPFALIIYALNKNGEPDWTQAEHLILDEVSNGKIVVQRGQWGSKPLSFKAGNAVVAEHMKFWTQQWQLNFSLHSPRGGTGNLTAAEWYAQKVAQRLASSRADGVEFDVGRWTWGFPGNNPMDVNNDRIADYGYIDGVNSFGLGGQVFFRTLRQIIGTDKIIQADSNDAIYGVRGWKYLNGVQLESFPAGNNFDRFSQAFLHLRLWTENAEGFPHTSYPFTKVPTTTFSSDYLPNGAPTDFRFRVGFAAACLLGMPHAFASSENINFDPANAVSNIEEAKQKFGVFDWDEYHAGALNDWQWLGRPLSTALQDFSDLDKTDLLAKTQWQWTIDKGFVAEKHQDVDDFSANVQIIPQGVIPEKNWFGVRLEPKNGGLRGLVSGKEYTIEFDARGGDFWHYAGQDFVGVPRMITISGSSFDKSNKPLSVLVDSKWRTYHLSFIADGSPAAVFGVSEQIGSTEISNIKLYAGGAERWSRRFEKGLVLLNMTNNPWSVVVPKGKYKHIKGKQAPSVNSGKVIDAEIIVPARDAVFFN